MVDAMWIKLENAILKEALLLQSDFSFGNFFKSNLAGATLKNSNFSFCDLRGAKLKCKTIENCIFTSAIFNSETEWMNNFNPEQYGAVYK